MTEPKNIEVKVVKQGGGLLSSAVYEATAKDVKTGKSAKGSGSTEDKARTLAIKSLQQMLQEE